jgi:ketosteroid isomerase-like protein
MMYKQVAVRTITILALIVWTSSLFNSAIADEPTLRELNRLYDGALIEADLKVLDRLYSADFKYISFQGEIRNKEEQIESLVIGRVDVLSGTSDQVEVRIYGNVAILTGRFIGRAKVENQEFAVAERYSTVWVQESGKWRLVLEHASMIKE